MGSMFGKIRHTSRLKDKGYFFIHTEGHPDIFCHITNVLSDESKIVVGAKVQYTAVPSRDGRLHAIDVFVIDESAEPAPQSFVSGKIEEGRDV